MGIFDSIPTPPVPAPISDAIGVGAPDQPTYNAQLPSYRAQLLSKYQTLGPQYATLHPQARQALLDYDSGRVARGLAPLTQAESLGAIQTIRTNQPATPAPSRDPLSFFSNAVSDIGDIVRGIPRLPAQLVSEVSKIPSAGQHISDAERAGQNPLQAITSAPGVRLIPGAYTLHNIAGGTQGLREAISHPVMSLFDVLPGAEKLAEGTEVGARATELADAAGRRPRALQAVLTRSLDEDGNLIRNPLGQAINNFQTQTRVGQQLDAFGGQMSRAAMRGRANIEAAVRGVNTGVIDPANEAERIARATQTDLAAKYKFPAELAADTMHRLERDDWAGATPEQLAYRTDYHTLNSRLADEGIAARDFGTIYNPRNPDVPELLPRAQATLINKAQTAAEHTARMATRRTAATLGSTRSLDELAADAQAIASHPTLPTRLKKVELRTLAHELDANGYGAQSSDLIRTINQPPRKGLNSPQQFADQLSSYATAPDAITPVTRHSAADLYSLFDAHGRAGSLQARRLADAIRDNNSPRIADALSALQSHVRQIPELANDPSIADSIRSYRVRNAYVRDKIPGYTDQLAAKSARAADRLIDANAPARFIPRIQDITNDRLTDYFRARAATPEEAAGVTKLVLDKNWSKLPGYEETTTQKLITDTAYDVSHMWRSLQEAGENPEYVHHVSARASLQPTISEVPNTVTQIKARALDATPYKRDATVAISHAANERITRAASELWIDQLVRGYGTKEQDLRAVSADRAQRIIDRTPGIDPNAAYQTVMTKTHTLFDPVKSGYNWGGSRLNSLATDNFWLPKALADNLERLHSPKSVMGSTLLDPIAHGFRVSVIALSPRALLHSIMGGATQTIGEIGLADTIKHIKTGAEYLRDPEAMLADPRVSNAMRASIGSEQAMFADMDRARFTGRAGDAAEFMKGRTIGRVWQQIQDAKAKLSAALPDSITGNAETGAKSLVQKSFDLHGFFHDMYAMTTYLAQHDKAVRAGLDPEVAQLSALELARKTLPDWTAQTPLERQLMKSIFPIYGVQAHTLRYALRYPIDHPLRANILASLSRAELEDNATLPGNFLSNLFITGQNSHGSATALNLATLNPVGDVANTLTLAGFISATNPAIQAALTGVGIDRGEAELYPTLRYDEETGQLAADHPNPFQALLNNTIPQANIATAIFGANSDFKDRLARDPWSAYRMLISSAGLPLLWRGLNPTVVAAQAEVAREKSAASVLSAAQKSGDWSEALRYPSLAAYYQQIKTLTPEQLTPFQARPDEQQQLEGAVRGQPGATGVVPVTDSIPRTPDGAPVAPAANTGGF